MTGPSRRWHCLDLAKAAPSANGGPEEQQRGRQKRKIIESTCLVGTIRDGGIDLFRRKRVQSGGNKNVAIEIAPRSGTGEECGGGHGNQYQSFQEIQNIPARGVNRDIGDNVFLRKNKESVDHDPPQQQDEDIEGAGQHPLPLIGPVWAEGHRCHDRDNVQEQDDIAGEGVGQRFANHEFEPRPASLVEGPHRHAHGHQSPEQACMSAAVEGVASRDHKCSPNHQQGDQVPDG